MVEVLHKQLVHVILIIMMKELLQVVPIKVVQFVHIPAKSVQVILQHAQPVMMQSVLLVEVEHKQHVPVMMVIMIQVLMLLVQAKVVIFAPIHASTVLVLLRHAQSVILH